jgi:Na+/proline symporter
MGGEMREILEAEQVGRLFAVLAVVLPPLCLIAGWWYGGRRQAARQGAIWGLAVGLLGPLNWVMWLVYNLITDSLGLDTVRNLIVNVGLFVVVGALIGVGAGFALRRAGVPPNEPRPTDELE